MKLKKIASLMLAGVMAVSMLAGCNTTSNGGNNGGGGWGGGALAWRGEGGEDPPPAVLVRDGASRDITLTMDALTDTEKQIVADGCLINYYKRG